MKIYNPESTEDFMDAKILNGNPNGILNFNRTPHTWATSIYRIMESYTWFPEECDLGDDKIPYNNLPGTHKYAYDMVLGQLITNDSVQAKQLVESISKFVTSPVPGACLTRQAYEETNHSRSYAVAAESICGDEDRIYNLYKHEPALARKNNAVEAMYRAINAKDVNELTDSEKLKAFAANQILEELVFPGGFIVMWSLGLEGTSKMISFIERDESGTHVPLFKNLFNTAVKEVGMDNKTLEEILFMIKDMANEEKIWTKHLSKNLLGFSPQAIDMFIEEKANSICRNLKLPVVFEITNGGPLMAIVQKYSFLSQTKTKTNFFESTVGDYSVNGLDENY